MRSQSLSRSNKKFTKKKRFRSSSPESSSNSKDHSKNRKNHSPIIHKKYKKRSPTSSRSISENKSSSEYNEKNKNNYDRHKKVLEILIRN